MTEQEFNAVLNEAEAEIENGDYYTTDEVRKLVLYTADKQKYLTEQQYKDQIDYLIDDANNGNTIPHAEVKSTMDKWVQDRLNGIL